MRCVDAKCTLTTVIKCLKNGRIEAFTQGSTVSTRVDPMMIGRLARKIAAKHNPVSSNALPEDVD